MSISASLQQSTCEFKIPSCGILRFQYMYMSSKRSLGKFRNRNFWNITESEFKTPPCGNFRIEITESEFKTPPCVNFWIEITGYISKSKSLNPSSKLPPGGIFEIQIPEQITEHEFKTSFGEVLKLEIKVWFQNIIWENSKIEITELSRFQNSNFKIVQITQMIPELTFPRGSFKIPKNPNLSLKLPRGSFKLENPKKGPNLSLKLPLGKNQIFSEIWKSGQFWNLNMNMSLKILKSEIWICILIWISASGQHWKLQFWFEIWDLHLNLNRNLCLWPTVKVLKSDPVVFYFAILPG